MNNFDAPQNPAENVEVRCEKNPFFPQKIVSPTDDDDGDDDDDDEDVDDDDGIVIIHTSWLDRCARCRSALQTR